MLPFSGKTKHPNVAVSSEETDFPGTILVSKKGKSIWHGLKTLDQLWYYLRKYESKRNFVRLVTANTVYGIQPFQDMIKQQYIMLFIGAIPEFTKLEQKEEIVAGCAVPIQRLKDLMDTLSKASQPMDKKTSYPPSIASKYWKRLATTEIRNVGSIAGNLFLSRKGFPSDLFIVLATLGARVTIASNDGSGMTSVEHSMMDFLLTDDLLNNTKIIYDIKIPYKPRQNVFMGTYKVSQRPQNSHALVNAGFSVKVMSCNFEEVKIYFGNITDKGPREMKATEKWMMKYCTPVNLCEELPRLLALLKKEMNDIATEDIKFSKVFRVDTACNIFFKYLLKMVKAFQFPNWKGIKNVRVKETANYIV